jgi:deoxyribonuclease V
MRRLHGWNVSYSQAGALQSKLSGRVRFIPLKRQPKLVAGLDCAFSENGKKIFAAVVVLRFTDFGELNRAELEVVETAIASRKVSFPYIPGLLSFREAPVCIDAVEKLQCQPDLFIVDGQGVAHPRRLGLAAHLGLFFDKPTVGCAKSRLIGEFEEPAIGKGAFSLLTDGGEVIGAVVRTRRGVKPVFISVGHKCLLEDAIRLTLECALRYRLPEPTRLAHHLVGRMKTRSGRF